MRKKTAPTISRMALTEARSQLGKLAHRVHVNKEIFILEKGGIPVAGLLDVDLLEDYLDRHDAAVQRDLKKSHADYLVGRTRPAARLLAELRTIPRNAKLAKR